MLTFHPINLNMRYFHLIKKVGVMRAPAIAALVLLLSFITVVPLAAQDTQRPLVAILDIQFTEFAISDGGIERITRLLVSGFAATRQFLLVPREHVSEALQQQNVASARDCPDTCKIDLMHRTAASKLIESRVIRADEQCSLIVDVYDAVTQTMEKSEIVRLSGCSESALATGIEFAVARLSGRLPEGSPDVALNTPLSARVAGADEGFLAVQGTPEGARVEVARALLSAKSPMNVSSIPVRPYAVPTGEYSVAVTMDGYEGKTYKVLITAGQTTAVSVALIKDTGRIGLSGEPIGARCTVSCRNGFTSQFGLSSTPWFITVPRGNCHVEVSRDGYQTFKEDINVAGGETVSREIRLSGLSAIKDSNPSGVEWIPISGGTFWMGSLGGSFDENPIHKVTISSFEMARTETTAGQYLKCVTAGVCTPPHWDDGRCLVFIDDGGYWRKANLPAHAREENKPVVCVDWGQANVFAKWAGGRLPTEAEWEYAARNGGKKEQYPWGDQKATCSYAVMDDGSGYGCGAKAAAPVCSRQSGNTAQGLCDIAGNVGEVTADWYGGFSAVGSVNPQGPKAGKRKVERGGSWGSDAAGLRSRWRSNGEIDLLHDQNGFRIVRDVH